MRRIFIVRGWQHLIIFLIVLLNSTPSYAISKFERFLTENPRLLMAIGIGVCVLLGAIIFGFNYISQKYFKDEKEKEIIARVSAFKKIPKGALGDVAIPPAKFIQIEANKEYEISSIRELTIGRSWENLVVVERSSISRHHAKIRPQKEGYVLYDLLSTMGTFVNDVRIAKCILRDGDLIIIGKESFMFKIEK